MTCTITGQFDPGHDVQRVVTDADSELVAVIGILDPSPLDQVQDRTISDFAVRPSSRRNGMGSVALGLLLGTNAIPEEARWGAYVRLGNTAALRFFERQGWTAKVDEAMCRFAFDIRTRRRTPSPS